MATPAAGDVQHDATPPDQRGEAKYPIGGVVDSVHAARPKVRTAPLRANSLLTHLAVGGLGFEPRTLGL